MCVAMWLMISSDMWLQCHQSIESEWLQLHIVISWHDSTFHFSVEGKSFKPRHIVLHTHNVAYKHFFFYCSYSLYEPKDSECKVGLKKALNLLLALLYGFCSLQLARRYYFLITKYCIECVCVILFL
ncbi:hypothetical protein EMCRGX_G015085 [Ephydatia muelleri]